MINIVKLLYPYNTTKVITLYFMFLNKLFLIKYYKGEKINKPVNIVNCFEKFSDTFSPKIIGELNGQYVLAVHLEGSKVPWHIHEDEDEMFYVIEGVLEILLENESAALVNMGEFFIVQKGIKHRVIPRGHVKLILFEPKVIKHTGKVESEITIKKFETLDI